MLESNGETWDIYSYSYLAEKLCPNVIHSFNKYLGSQALC